jgi:hypothetical protein
MRSSSSESDGQHDSFASRLEYSWRCSPDSFVPRAAVYSSSPRHLLVTHVESLGPGALASVLGLVGGLLRVYTRSAEADAAAVYNLRPQPDWIPVLNCAIGLASCAPHLALGALGEAFNRDQSGRLGVGSTFGTCAFEFSLTSALVCVRVCVCVCVCVCVVVVVVGWGGSIKDSSV